MFNRQPVYLQLLDKLKKDIAAGRLGPPGRVISARELARTYDLSRDTVNKAMGELRALGYVSREPGRGFRLLEPGRSRSSMTVGLVTTYAQPSADGFYGSIMGGMESRLRQEGYLLAWHGSGPEEEVDPDYLRALHAEGRVDGFLLLAVEDTRFINNLARAGIPLVAVDYHDPELACSSVSLDHRGACALAVEHLLRREGGDFAVVTREPEKDYPSAERLAGFTEALAARGLDLSHSRIFAVREGAAPAAGESYSEMMARQYLDIVRKCGPATTFLTAYSYHALHLLWAARRVFPEAPARAATFGGASAVLAPGEEIAALYTDSHAMGVQAAELLLDTLRNPKGGSRHVRVPMFLRTTRGRG